MVRKGFLFIMLIISFSMLKCSGQTPSNGIDIQLVDTATTIVIKSYLEEEKTSLHFPNLTQSLYRQNNYKNIWFDQNKSQSLLWETMMLLDCVTQYGLTPSSYHSTQLTYDNIQKILNSELTGTNHLLKAKTDVLLTDAMITFMVHLHFGKLNPSVSANEIDSEDFNGYRVDSVLLKALQQPALMFSGTILSVQPKIKSYQQLQDYLRLTIHQYAGECYEIAEDTLKLIAINLERYKWINSDENTYIHINIPAFTLDFMEGDSAQNFKIIVGKPSTPTPAALESKIWYFTTAPYWTVPASIFRNEILPKALRNPAYLSRNNLSIYTNKGTRIASTLATLQTVRKNPSAYFARQSPGRGNALGQIVFRFKNPYSIYLHDTPNRNLFKQPYRALSHGCIRVEKVDVLAKRLLTADSASPTIYDIVSKSMSNYKQYNYTFEKQIPIIISYITCTIKDGQLIKHPDLYKRDENLIWRLFKSNLPATSVR